MTISDMSIVAAEVKVDETDITNVRDGDAADVTIDAIPGKIFKGNVTQVGDEAILRSSGQAATTQTTANTQEARDFKVVVTLDNPPDAAASGTFGERENPNSAQERRVDDADSGAGGAHARRTSKRRRRARRQRDAWRRPSRWPRGDPEQKVDVQGVFVVRGKKAEFVPVQTGITGVTDIEITSGLKDGDEIVIGSYKALRTLRPGASVKVDNSAPKHEDSVT